LKSCTILTADAAASIRKIHHRMPVMVKPEAYETWLDPAGIGQEDFRRLVSEQSYRDFETHPVDKAANSPENDDPSLFGPLFDERR
jgi:putative SOS response-associated peptidase YedK